MHTKYTQSTHRLHTEYKQRTNLTHSVYRQKSRTNSFKQRAQMSVGALVQVVLSCGERSLSVASHPGLVAAGDGLCRNMIGWQKQIHWKSLLVWFWSCDDIL